MTQGLRCWNAAGELTLEITDRLSRYHGSITIGSISPRGIATYSMPGYSTDGTWFMFLRAGNWQYMRIIENANSIQVFNENYIYALGSGLVIDIFRG